MKQVLTVSCKLQVSPEQSAQIDATLQAFADACEYLTLLGLKARGFLVQSVGLPVDVTTSE
ncbi:MAG: hypothetical protein WBL95_16815 [Microcoleus sp.]